MKASRKWPEFSQNAWAQGLGFSSYRRLYRACLAVFGKTPHQMEMELIREVLAEGEPVEAGNVRYPKCPCCLAGRMRLIPVELSVAIGLQGCREVRVNLVDSS